MRDTWEGPMTGRRGRFLISGMLEVPLRSRKSRIFIFWASSDLVLNRSVSLWRSATVNLCPILCCAVHSEKLKGEMVVLFPPLSLKRSISLLVRDPACQHYQGGRNECGGNSGRQCPLQGRIHWTVRMLAGIQAIAGFV